MAVESIYPTSVRFDFMKWASQQHGNTASLEEYNNNDSKEDEWWNWDRE